MVIIWIINTIIAALFDFDGVIMDTEGQYTISFGMSKATNTWARKILVAESKDKR